MNDKVVCNTGPLIALAKTGRLGILKSLYGEVLIPPDVSAELAAGTACIDEIAALAGCPFIVVSPVLIQQDAVLNALLDPGEAAAIRLAVEVGAAWLLIDESRGRKVAADIYGLHVRGTAGIMVEAKKRGLVRSVEVELMAMRDHGYWIAGKVIEAACEAVGER